MKNRLFLLAFAWGLSLSSQALVSSEQEYIPAITELQRSVEDSLVDYAKNQINNGKRLDLGYVSTVIISHGLDLQRLFYMMDVEMTDWNYLVFLQDYVNLTYLVGDSDTLAILEDDIHSAEMPIIRGIITQFEAWYCDDVSYDFKKSLYMDAALFAEFQKTMELFIEKGADRAPYDAFMVEFEAYKAAQE